MEKIRKFFADMISVGSTIETGPFMALCVSVMGCLTSVTVMKGIALVASFCGSTAEFSN